MKKLVLICLDGATWDIIDPLIDKGELPNFQALKMNGSFCDLITMDKMMSPVIWNSIVTGKVSEKHGIVDFYSTESDLTSSRFWEILFSVKGLSYGLFNFFYTYPPDKKSIFCLPGVLARGPEAHPSFLKFIKDIREKDKKLNVVSIIKDGINAVKMGLSLKTILSIVGLICRYIFNGKKAVSNYAYKKFVELFFYCDIFCWLAKKYKPDVTVWYENASDLISHYFWKEWESNKTNSKGEIYMCYKNMDYVIGRIQRILPPEAHVFVISDHGFEDNEKEGMMTTIKIEKLLFEMGVNDKIFGTNIGHITYLRPKKGVLGIDIIGEVEEKLKSINLTKFDFHLIEVKKDSENELQCSLNNDEIRENLERINENSELIAWGKSYRMKDFFDFQPKITGRHHKKGIFIASGPNIKANNRIKPASIYDVTPTILRLLGTPSAKDMDGTILKQVFTEKFGDSYNEELVESYESTSELNNEDKKLTDQEEEILKEKLRAMGYLS